MKYLRATLIDWHLLQPQLDLQPLAALSASGVPQPARDAETGIALDLVRMREPARRTVDRRRHVKSRRLAKQTSRPAITTHHSRPIHSGCPDKCESAFVIR